MMRSKVEPRKESLHIHQQVTQQEISNRFLFFEKRERERERERDRERERERERQRREREQIGYMIGSVVEGGKQIMSKPKTHPRPHNYI